MGFLRDYLNSSKQRTIGGENNVPSGRGNLDATITARASAMFNGKTTTAARDPVFVNLSKASRGNRTTFIGNAMTIPATGPNTGMAPAEDGRLVSFQAPFEKDVLNSEGRPPRLSKRERNHYCFHLDLSPNNAYLHEHLNRYIEIYGAVP